ncbi:cobyrinic acid a,c-diamide synthase [Prosthecochloris sp. GSB1]|nr:cobyrinic acid a,c-diamide synthase [Prosthecochloris sp. GSB1]
MISAASKSSGKTTVSLGLLRHFSSLGERMTSFKKGPDYIDPMWHRRAGSCECRNLDAWMMGKDACRRSFVFSALDSGGIALVEGNHGLHDGLAVDGSDSSAGMAELLDLPVLLVVDSRRMNRGVAAQVLGMQLMPPKVRIAGVILNHVASSRQESKQRHAIETYCGVPVLGALPAEEGLRMPERHLGLVTVDEALDAEGFIGRAAEMVSRHCDTQTIRRLFDEASPLDIPFQEELFSAPVAQGVNIGVFRDAAFCFYYPENIEALRARGAEPVFIDTFRSRSLPDIDGLYLGGGFPESFFPELSSRTALHGAVREKVEGGMPVWAECGGLVYLSRSAVRDGKRWPMAGVLPLDVEYGRRPVGCGYVELESIGDSPWFAAGEKVRAHEFHYSGPAPGKVPPELQFSVAKGYGFDGKADGIVYRNLFASYAHLHATSTPGWAERFVALAQAYRNRGRIAVE